MAEAVGIYGTVMGGGYGLKREEQEWMERYIYQVVRRLPKGQREEARMELQELISDMREQAASMEEVLGKLGDPAVFAGKYRDDVSWLIGPEYYDTWSWFLKVVLISSTILVFVVSLVQGMQEGFARAGDGDLLEAVTMSCSMGLGNGIAEAVITAIGCFGTVTFLFAILERQKIRLDRKQAKKRSKPMIPWNGQKETGEMGRTGSGDGRAEEWMPEQLTPVPHPKAVISKGDSIVGIVGIMVVGILLSFAPGIFSVVFSVRDRMEVIPLLNLEQWGKILPVMIVSLVLGLADEILHLVYGAYCRVVMIANMVSNLVQIILAVLLLKVFPFWNPNFAQELHQRIPEQEKIAWFLRYWNEELVSNGILAIVVMITVLEVGVTVYKTLRYGKIKSDVIS